MAYTIHIHRKPGHWRSLGKGEITADELRTLGAKYPHLDFVERCERIGMGVCCGGEVRWDEENILFGFALKDGALHGAYTDDETIHRALYLAALLGAKVQGDEGEFYRAGPDGIEHFR